MLAATSAIAIFLNMTSTFLHCRLAGETRRAIDRSIRSGAILRERG
jgi:hypothetical protein